VTRAAEAAGPSVRRQLDREGCFNVRDLGVEACLHGGGLTDADIDALRARMLAPGAAAG
jgi:hypothetical protein